MVDRLETTGPVTTTMTTTTIASPQPQPLQNSTIINASPRSDVNKIHSRTSTIDTSATSTIDNNKLLISTVLYKRSRHTRQWKKKWVVLRKCQLSYYKDSKEYKPLKVYHGEDLLSFSIIPDHTKNHFALYTSNKVLHFRAPDETTFHQWVDTLNEYFSSQDNEDDDTQLLDQQQQKEEEEEEDSLNKEEPRVSDADPSPEEDHDSQVSSPPANNQQTLPIHSIQNKQQAQVRRSTSLTDSINTSTEFSDCSSEAWSTIDSPITPGNAVNMNNGSSLFNTLDVPNEEDERRRIEPSLSSHPSQPPPPIESTKNKPQSSTPNTDLVESVIEQGYMTVLKKKYNRNLTKRVYLVLTNVNLKVYKTQEDYRTDSQQQQQQQSFELIYKNYPINDILDIIELDPMTSKYQWCLLIITPLKRIRFCCHDEEDMMKWFSALKAVVVTQKKKQKEIT
ncbi:Hap43p-repressed protein [Candida albicans Ca6]|nr:Hap43p-repressed protein [Candida albicans Ca6]